MRPVSKAKAVLITGASSGIGLATARLLAEQGHAVVGTSRHPAAVSAANFDLVELDVTSDDSVAQCVATVLERLGRVDVLVNNAGYGLLGFCEETSVAQAHDIFETNYFGAVRMIRAVLPAMRAQQGGLIINVASVAGYVGVPFESHYCATKFALDGLSQALRHEVAGFGIKVSVVNPGFMRTNFAAAAHRAADRIAVYDDLRQRIVEAFAGSFRAGSDPDTVARGIARIVRSASPRLRYWAGRDAIVFAWARRLVPEAAIDAVLRRRFRVGKA